MEFYIKSLQEAYNTYDSLKGCVNRFFVTDDKEEVDKLLFSAHRYLDLLYFYHQQRLLRRDNKKSGD